MNKKKVKEAELNIHKGVCLRQLHAKPHKLCLLSQRWNVETDGVLCVDAAVNQIVYSYWIFFIKEWICGFVLRESECIKNNRLLH